MVLAIQLDHRYESKWMLNESHRLGYTESYTETQNYKYCFLNIKNREDVPDTSESLYTIVEETDEHINDDVAVDSVIDAAVDAAVDAVLDAVLDAGLDDALDAALEDQSLITAKVTASESELKMIKWSLESLCRLGKQTMQSLSFLKTI